MTDWVFSTESLVATGPFTEAQFSPSQATEEQRKTTEQQRLVPHSNHTTTTNKHKENKTRKQWKMFRMVHFA
eukprot:m.86782 g.86782  ORF g.86782 m.86782 type:complete len:72 (-) comp21360_c0_seq1:2719-2934(-)